LYRLALLSDLGEAIIRKENNKGDIMPGIYRTPEVILDMDWDHKVDIWSIGCMVSEYKVVSFEIKYEYSKFNQWFRFGTW
jgi:hypothetical protein